MDLAEQISHQRVKHIVSSYHLDGEDGSTFAKQLQDLLITYPSPLMELALVEILVEQWLTIPPVRGLAFLTQVQQKLLLWEQQPITTTITPEQFEQISGLNPDPIFGSPEKTPVQLRVYPL